MSKKTERGAGATSHKNVITKKPKTQEEMVLAYIVKNGSITTMDAFNDLGITRLSGRIHDLRRDGYDIEMSWETSASGARYGRYTLNGEFGKETA